VKPAAIYDDHREPKKVGDVFNIDLSRTAVGASLRELEQRR
jgi:hypothetical protein